MLSRKEIKQLKLEASLKGEVFFYGNPCKHNHDTKRYVDSGRCYRCNAVGVLKRYHKLMGRVHLRGIGNGNNTEKKNSYIR